MWNRRQCLDSRETGQAQGREARRVVGGTPREVPSQNGKVDRYHDSAADPDEGEKSNQVIFDCGSWIFGLRDAPYHQNKPAVVFGFSIRLTKAAAVKR